VLLLDRDRWAPVPEQGVIEEARRRQRRRRSRAAGATVTALLLAIAGGILVATLGGGPHRGARQAYPSPPRLARSDAGGARVGQARLAPALEGGSYGWTVMLGGGGSCCAGTPARGNLAGALIEEHAGYEALTLLSGPEVAAVIVNGVKRLPVTPLPVRLPFDLRLIQVKIPRAGPFPGLAQALIPLDARGHDIRSFANPELRISVRWWERPARLPQRPCRLRTLGLSGLTPQWGHLASAILPYPGHIIGQAFFSCIDIEYYLQGWPLDAAILLDAGHPGALPAAIPGLVRVPGAPGFFNGPGDYHGELTASRRGNTWLVVAGGSGLSQRMQVLRHLRASYPQTL
jgi:hypothetical protein